MKVERVMWVVKTKKGRYMTYDLVVKTKKGRYMTYDLDDTKSLSRAGLFSSRRGAAKYCDVKAGETLARVMKTIEEI
jgi:hypothetical protein